MGYTGHLEKQKCGNNFCQLECFGVESKILLKFIVDKEHAEL